MFLDIAGQHVPAENNDFCGSDQHAEVWENTKVRRYYLYTICYIHLLGVDLHERRQKFQWDIRQRRTTESRGSQERAVLTQIRQYPRMYPLYF